MPTGFLVVEIGEFEFLIVERFGNARFVERHLGIADVAGSFADSDRGTPGAEHLSGGDDHRGVGGHVGDKPGRFDHVGFKEDALANEVVGR